LIYRCPRIIVAGLRGGSGKTTLSIGLISAFMERGLGVTPFKKGPDYIDAGWLSAAAKRPCYNLDPFLIGQEKVISSFISHFDSDIALIEGNRGVFDGMDSEGSFSTAKVAKTLRCPVILIIDCSKMTRTIASMIIGVKKFDPSLRLKAVILNQVAGKRHESILRESIERYTTVPVAGAIYRVGEKTFPERHMGLTPHQEHPHVEKAISDTARLIARQVDVDMIIGIAENAPKLRGVKRQPSVKATRGPGHKKNKGASPRINAYASVPVRIGVIRDSAFQFYYPENFEELEKAGAEIVEFSALKKKALPMIHALYIGGGFPETHAIALSGNDDLRESLASAIEGGLPVYAECGGLMYLGEFLSFGGKKYRMAGVLPVGFTLEEKPQAHGYTIAKAGRENPFFKKGVVLRGHEFHYSKPVSFKKKKGVYFAFQMQRGQGIKNMMDGLCYKNVLATYTHTHALGLRQWTEGMLHAAENFRRLRRALP
jgi:cobyrinic acid a,c-diamide synthase